MNPDPDVPVTATELLDRARRSTGLTDMGPDGWQEGLGRLLDAGHSDLRAAPAAMGRLESSIEQRLVNRLRIESWYRDQVTPPPPVEAIVVIHGLPRTATTALHYLLAQGSDFRYQRRWEMGSPVPPSGRPGDEDDPRRRAALEQAGGTPAGSVQHIYELDGPCDDNAILGLGFHNQELGLPLPTYTRWWRTADLTSTYAYHDRVLSMLHAGLAPKPWLVKAPYHNFHLDDLAARYPQARFVMAHRDPAAALPSACSTVAAAQHAALPEVTLDPLQLGSFLQEHLVEGVDRAMAARAVIGEDRFLDVQQHQMETDAVATAERIYRFLGLELDPATRTRMARWAATNRRGARGAHRYSAEQYGLTRAGIRQAFGPYIERFGIGSESD